MMRLLLSPEVITAPAGAPAPAPAVAAPAPVVAAPPVVPAGTTAIPAAPPWAPPAPVASPAAAPPAPAKAPETYDLKVPDGMSMDAAALEKFKSSMKELGADPTLAQKILDRDLTAQKAAAEADVQFIKTQDATWMTELRGRWGEKYGERAETVKRAFDFADPSGDFRKKLEASGLSSNPDLIEFVEKFGGLMKEGKIQAGANSAPASKDNRPLHERSVDAFRELNRKTK